MTPNTIIYTFVVDGKEVEIKAASSYDVKKRAKRMAGVPSDVKLIGKREVK